MNRYTVKTVSIKITWKSGAKSHYNNFPLKHLPYLLNLYSPEMAQIKKLTIREETQPNSQR